MNHRPELIVGSACIVLFGFMFYKQTMLQAEVKRLRSQMEATEVRRVVTEMSEKSHQDYQQEQQQDHLAAQDNVCLPYSPPPRNIPRTDADVIREEHGRYDENESEAPPGIVPKVAGRGLVPATEDQYFDSDIDHETQAKIDQLVAARRVAK